MSILISLLKVSYKNGRTMTGQLEIENFLAKISNFNRKTVSKRTDTTTLHDLH